MKGNQTGIRERAERLLAREAFPPDDTVSWEKGHHRLERRRLKRVSVSPEEIGLRGTWPVLAVRRETVFLGRRAKAPSDEIGHYITSVAAAQLTDEALLAAIRGTGTRWRTGRNTGAT